MTFSEHTKLQVKRRAHFMCCLCHAIGIEVHHLIPDAQGGVDTEDNAAPLCPSCHETYGANPEKRKFIREARNFWYEICASRYSSDLDRLDRINALLSETASKADLDQAVGMIISVVRSTSVSSSDHVPPLTEAWNEIGLTRYLRWLYPDVTHCGGEALGKLFIDLEQVGYTSIAELHEVVGDTREGFRQFAANWRDSGGNVDLGTDNYPIRLFLALFDEKYSRLHYPNSFKDHSPEMWRRRESAAIA